VFAAGAGRESVETANLALAAAALLAAAELRAESRGCHVRNDHPDRSPSGEHSVLVRQVDGGITAAIADLRPAVAWA
jgi:L-aspartate oxidase